MKKYKKYPVGFTTESLPLKVFVMHKEVPAIRRIFSLVDMNTITKFSNCPNVFCFFLNWYSLVVNYIYIVGNKIRFKAIHQLQYRVNVHFLLPPLI